jgi:hypothetical protein
MIIRRSIAAITLQWLREGISNIQILTQEFVCRGADRNTSMKHDRRTMNLPYERTPLPGWWRKRNDNKKEIIIRREADAKY